MRRLGVLVTTFALASVLLSLGPADSAQAAPRWCKAWKVAGQTWYAYQDNGFTLLFTLRMGGPTRFGGYARFNRGDPNRGGVPSQFIRGGVVSDGVGRIVMDIVWSNGTSGQYHATAYGVRRTRSGGLTAGLRGTTVDTSGSGAPGARWDADGTQPTLGATGRTWPLYCSPRDVVG